MVILGAKGFLAYFQDIALTVSQLMKVQTITYKIATNLHPSSPAQAWIGLVRYI
jgi:hypothetical protein